ncbi:hypothetical protein [Flagellimonas nanhaiensis]|uniref:Uncharacterized protein n=1 Tax=Flagellimonas nanhaiensis TaxID=2292706 RepID=A0A371JL76_9FLAO|nr:hypothetical protein [Allomuricauda nanhaiensis]RDY57712.1 hypothetical protein DX873_17590 [Allomuricauda nanhaiensis]
MKENKAAISEEVALNEFKEFLKKFKKREFRRGKITDEKILDDYPNIIDALMDGLLVLENKETGKPVFTLRFPIETEGKNEALAVKTVTFKTRTKPSDMVRLLDGINPQTQQAKYVMRYLQHVTNLAQGEIDNLDKDDYDTISQLATVFQ